MCPFAASFGVAFILLLTTFGTNGIPAVRTYRLNMGDPCPPSDNYPKSHCKLAEICVTYEPYLEHKILMPDDILGCGFLNSSHSYMICCPDALPGLSDETITESDIDVLVDVLVTEFPNINEDDVIENPMDNALLTTDHLASLGYLKPITLDDIIYRCTAIIVAPNKVLASKQCVGSKLIERPNRVLVGVTDPRSNFDTELEFQLRQSPQFYHDLVLINLVTSIDEETLNSQNVSIATFCDEADLKGTPTMFALGFSQNDGHNCDLFSSFKMKKGNCADVMIGPELKQHPGLMCLQQQTCPISYRSESCTQCLTASSSVLHVERRDGSFCVAGIATPTTDKCIVNEEPVYYTSLVSSAAKRFLGGLTNPTFRGSKSNVVIL